jgi:hypothetical protein
MSCVCDIEVDDVCLVLHDEERTARKEHRCKECRETISPGEKYTHEATVFDGRMESIKTCIGCRRIRDEHFPNGFVYGEMRQDFYECCGYDYLNEWPVQEWSK